MVIRYEKKSLECPACRFARLIDSVVGIKSETFPEDKMPNGWYPDYFQKCGKCGKQIGIRKVS